MNCDPEMLWTVVEQSGDPGPELEAVARHLESCETCRRTISDYGGANAWWSEARRWLRVPQDEDFSISENQTADSLPRPPVDLSFLEQPSHPEMLGRIGRYDVHGVLGRGGMGVVLRAYDSDLQRSVAVKVMAPEWAASEPARQRFAREAQAAASVAHENVIPIYNVEATASLPYLVMRYVPGATLESWIRTHGPLDPATILRVAGQMVEGLAAAHRRGLVHRDIKPGNVLVGENIERVWITDFGLARAADSVTLTQTGVIAGTPHYMSPEQARGEAIDHRSDLFSLGSVLYFMSAGHPPFDAENTLAVLHKLVSQRPDSLANLRSDLPPSFVRLVDGLLRRSVEQRPEGCEQVLKSLAEAQSEQKRGLVAARPLSRRIKTVIGSVVVASLVIGIGLAAFRFSVKSARSAPGSGLDPWTAADSNAAVEPYDAAASHRINTQIMLATADIDRETTQLKKLLNRMEREPPVSVKPSIGTDFRQWDRDLQRIRQSLKRLENQ